MCINRPFITTFPTFPTFRYFFYHLMAEHARLCVKRNKKIKQYTLRWSLRRSLSLLKLVGFLDEERVAIKKCSEFTQTVYSKLSKTI